MFLIKVLNKKFCRQAFDFKKDYYKILGVKSSATDAQIKAAYYQKAKEMHPDLHPQKENQFKTVNQAYKVLSNSLQRKQYDSFKSNGNSYQQPSPYARQEYRRPYDSRQSVGREEQMHKRRMQQQFVDAQMMKILSQILRQRKMQQQMHRRMQQQKFHRPKFYSVRYQGQNLDHIFRQGLQNMRREQEKHEEAQRKMEQRIIRMERRAIMVKELAEKTWQGVKSMVKNLFGKS